VTKGRRAFEIHPFSLLPYSTKSVLRAYSTYRRMYMVKRTHLYCAAPLPRYIVLHSVYSTVPSQQWGHPLHAALSGSNLESASAKSEP